MAEADETIITRFVVEADEALKKSQELRVAIDGIKVQLKSLSTEGKESLAVISKGMIDAFKSDRMKQASREMAESLDVKGATQRAQADIQTYKTAMTQALKEVRQEQTAYIKGNQQQVASMKDLETQTKQTGQGFRLFGQEIKSVGDVAKVVLLGIFGVSVLSILRSLINGLKESAQAAYEFSKAIFQLEIGVRALQRAGVDITIQQMYDQLKNLKKEFGIFAFTDLVKGASQFVNLNRDMGFTRDQLFELQKSVATLAVVNGRAMDEVQRTVALAISSGYTEGLQRLGVSINRVTIANEAARLGFAKSYMSLTEQQRALATYNLIIQKTAIYQDDLLTYQEKAPGQIDKASAAWRDIKRSIGEALIPIAGVAAKVFVGIIDAITGADEKLKNFNETLYVFIGLLNPLRLFALAFNGISNSVEALGKVISGKGNIQDFVDAWKEAFDEIKSFTPGLEGGMLGDTAITDQARLEKQAQQIETAVSDHVDDIEKVVEDSGERQRELAINLQEDLEQITRDGLRRREELEREYQRRIADINRDTARDIEDANRQYANDLAELAIDTARREQELIEKQHQRELDDEQKFQERMRKLRESFLFDVEEAVRARDAVQIRRLQRRFEFERNELITEREQEKKDRAKDFQRELEDLRRQAAEKRKELAIQFQQKLEDIARQRQQELNDAAIKHQQDLEDLRRSEEDKRKERMIAYRQELEDLTRQQNDRLRKIAEALAKEINLTGKGAQAVYDTLKAYFGPGGAIDQLYQYYIQSTANVGNAVNGLLPNPNPPSPPSKQFGGEVYKGGMYKVHKDETYVPAINGRILSVQQSQEAVAQALSGASKGGGEGRLRISVALSDGLVGEIVEKSLDEFDGVLASLERSR